ncbi:C-factor-like isoform X1 [Corvus cornix cornix]|uniref:C-factor-like isoform X1 n=1 Tax=Corvus cornix cornix TaxID=932674 RepID=UPI00194F25E4|nr:C-factor-like isoform X1 [Corvus cornix cornix]XP_039414250.1 C-factor-like isoform X1 [Corvus cornix cornix]
MDMDQSQEIEVQAENFREPRAGASPHGNMRDNQVAKGTSRVQARAVQPQLEQHGRAPRPLPSGDWGQPGHRPGARPAFPEDAKSSTVDLCRLSEPQGTESAEVTNPASIKAAAAKVGEHLGGSGLNLLINNAGIIKPKTLDSETLEDMTETYTTNTAGPLLMGQAFLPLLKKAAQGSLGSGLSCSKAAIINISSIGGSFSSFFTWDVIQATSYRCSKAALNMLSKCQSLAYREHGVLCVALHPGWVQTDMGSSAGHTPPVTVDDSVQGMLKVLSSLSEKETGTFLDWEGNVIPW